MLKKRKILIISVLAAVVVLTMGIIGGVVYASSSTSSANTPVNPQMALSFNFIQGEHLMLTLYLISGAFIRN
jgi:hypothetical protein